MAFQPESRISMSRVTMIFTVNLITTDRNCVLAPCLFLHFVKSHVLGKSLSHV
jgi:hypothetical protein